MLSDAHTHFFQHGYQETKKRGFAFPTSDLQMYSALRTEFVIKNTLVVGWEGKSWATGNNDYIEKLANQNDWMVPLAFIRPQDLSIKKLKSILAKDFKGISLYVNDESDELALSQIPVNIWSLLSERMALVSCNSRSRHWGAWQKIMKDSPDLYLLISHLGLPTSKIDNVPVLDFREIENEIFALSNFKNIYMKISGFYGQGSPEDKPPYKSTWNYLDCVLENFTHSRLIFGSDFPPALEYGSFADTLSPVLLHPKIDELLRHAISFENLDQLIKETQKT